jgi:hypothetical protein
MGTERKQNHDETDVPFGDRGQHDYYAARILQLCVEKALNGDPVGVSLIKRLEPGAREMGNGWIIDDYETKRRRKMQ